MTIDRRTILKTALLSSAAAGFANCFPSIAQAQGKAVTVIDWGGNYIENIKAISGKLTGFDVTYDVHAGDATATLTKIKTTWPKSDYDVVAGYDAVFSSMIAEGWVETFTLDEIPNAKDVPSKLFMKDAAGNLKAIPRSIMGLHWGYMKETCPFPITNIRDLLDPRLKGLVLFQPPQSSANMQMISIAYALGGSEKDLESAWAFVKQLAEMGNIGRVSLSDADTFTSLTTGETAVTFQTSSGFQRAETVTPVERLARMPEDSGFKTGIAMEGWIIVQTDKAAVGKAWINDMLSPENNEAFCTAVGSIPANSKAKVSEAQKYLAFTEEEYAKYVFPMDWAYVGQHLDEWTQRWEKEIAPFL
jgi:putative spermidine/putrescine transport system substrate-binding protein